MHAQTYPVIKYNFKSSIHFSSNILFKKFSNLPKVLKNFWMYPFSYIHLLLSLAHLLYLSLNIYAPFFALNYLKLSADIMTVNP